MKKKTGVHSSVIHNEMQRFEKRLVKTVEDEVKRKQEDQSLQFVKSFILKKVTNSVMQRLIIQELEK